MAISHLAGEFIGFSEGEYSDYSFSDLYRVLVDFDMAAATQQFIPYLKAKALLEGQRIPDYVEDHELPEHLADACRSGSSVFGSYLMRQGFLEPIPYIEIHLGSYGSFGSSEVINHSLVRAEHLSRNSDT